MTAVLEFLAGCLAGGAAGGLYFLTLRWSIEQAGGSRASLLIGAALRLAVILALIAAALWLGAGPAHLAGGLAGFVVARRAAVALFLRKPGRRP